MSSLDFLGVVQIVVAKHEMTPYIYLINSSEINEDRIASHAPLRR